MENDIKLIELVNLIKELRQQAMNDPKAKASTSVTCLLLAYDSLLAKVIEEKKVA